MKKIAIFHFRPIELYPPAMNFLNYLGECESGTAEIRVYTTWPASHLTLFVAPAHSGISIIRYGRLNKLRGTSYRYSNYINHIVKAWIGCLLWKPSVVLYYESISAMVPYLLYQTLGSKLKLMVHYHEYMEPRDYDNSSLIKRIHGMEKRLFSRLSWISHTNARRAELFLRDEPNADRNLIRIIPNYPPRNWSHGMDTNATDGVIRIVYVGALGMKTMYVSELANWVEAQGGRFIWDIYTQQNDTELSEFLKSRSFRNVRSMGYVPYGKLASLLSRYDIGVILYRVKTDNFRYNAPNKLFEYLNCGLHVWFPRDMEGILPYVNEGGRPKVVSVNYEVSTSIDAAAESTKQHAGSMASFYCEDVYPPFKESLLG